jgi:hypothetical protein
MLPTARGANGQPPSPPIELSKSVMPRSRPASALARPRPRVLCRCSPIRWFGKRAQALDRARDQSRVRHAGGVGEVDERNAVADELLEQPMHTLKQHRPLIGAAECRRDAANQRTFRTRHDGRDLLDGAHALLGGHAYVELVERVAHRDAGFHVIDIGGDRAFCTARVHDQAGIAHARPARDAREHHLRIGHLRHDLGMHEGGDLDPGEPRRRQAVDQRDLLLGRQEPLLDLQPVARADLADSDLLRPHRNSSQGRVVWLGRCRRGKCRYDTAAARRRGAESEEHACRSPMSGE